MLSCKDLVKQVGGHWPHTPALHAGVLCITCYTVHTNARMHACAHKGTVHTQHSRAASSTRTAGADSLLVTSRR